MDAMLKRQTPMSKIPFGYYQIFEKPFILSVNDIQIVKMKDEGIITKSDLEIVRFVYENHFLSERQLILLAKEFGKGLTKTQVKRLLELRLLNRFNLSRREDDDFTPSGLVVYCLDIGGKYLLEKYSNENVINWTTADAMMDSGLVAKKLIAGEFKVALLKGLSDKITHHRSHPKLKLKRDTFVPSGELQLKNDLMLINFLLQVVTINDYPTQLREIVDNYSYLLETHAWKKYYFEVNEAPTLFFLTDTVDTALLVGRLMQQNTEIEKYRMVAAEGIVDVFEKGILLKYDAENDRIVKVRNKMFLLS